MPKNFGDTKKQNQIIIILQIRLKFLVKTACRGLSVTCDRLVIFTWYSALLHQYKWNIVDSGLKHNKPNQTKPDYLIIFFLHSPPPLYRNWLIDWCLMPNFSSISDIFLYIMAWTIFFMAGRTNFEILKQ